MSKIVFSTDQLSAELDDEGCFASFADPSFSSEEAARAIGVSRRYVNDLFHESGNSFAERVLEFRLQKARTMLAKPRYDGAKIGDLAFACGFNDISYFHRCFRRRFGASPAAYRGLNEPG